MSELMSDSLLLKEALACEKASPEILTFKEGLVGRIAEHLRTMDSKVASLDSDYAAELARTLYQYEESRVKYMLRSYLRVRCMKIEKYAMAILDDEVTLEKLSDKEREFAEGYVVMLGGHLKQTVLNHMPHGFESLVYQSAASAEKDMLPQPNLDTHCFCRVTEDIGIVDLGNNTTEFSKDDLYVARYRPLRQLLEAEKIKLI